MRYLILLSLLFLGCRERVVYKQTPPRIVERVVEKRQVVIQPRPVVVQPRPVYVVPPKKPGVHIHIGPHREKSDD
jgi:hypothetical protein